MVERDAQERTAERDKFAEETSQRGDREGDAQRLEREELRRFDTDIDHGVDAELAELVEHLAAPDAGAEAPRPTGPSGSEATAGPGLGGGSDSALTESIGDLAQVGGETFGAEQLASEAEPSTEAPTGSHRSPEGQGAAAPTHSPAGSAPDARFGFEQGALAQQQAKGFPGTSTGTEGPVEPPQTVGGDLAHPVEGAEASGAFEGLGDDAGGARGGDASTEPLDTGVARSSASDRGATFTERPDARAERRPEARLEGVAELRVEGPRPTASARPDAPAQAPARPDRPLSAEQAAQVFKQVRMRIASGADGLREATVHLQPAWLGRVSIRIAVREGRALAEVRAERPEALGALERHLPELRVALAERGFEQVDFDLGLASDARGDAEQGSGGLSGGRTADHRTAHLAVPAELADTHAAPARPGASNDLGIDTYA